MKKRIALMALVIAAFSFAGYGTLAYFTASEKAENVITAGNVKIDLCEETADGDPFPEDGMTGIMPGETVDKVVYVKNVGENTAWIRVKPEKELTFADGTKAESGSFEQYIDLNLNQDDWTEKDGWYYYRQPVDAGTQTGKLFTQVTFSEKMGNTYKNSTVHIEVNAQAVQTANNGSSVLEAAGWPAE